MLKVLSAGLVLLEGDSRAGFSNHGVPLSGAFDKERMQQANYLVGNPLDAEVFELHSGKFEFYADRDILVSVVGAGEVVVSADGNKHFVNYAFKVPAYAFVSVTHTPGAFGLTYVGVSGLKGDKVLGSASYDTFSKLGTKPVSAGDIFELGSGYDEYVSDRILLSCSSIQRVSEIPFLVGPHYDELNPAASALTVQIKSLARSGVRLVSREGFFGDTFSNRELMSIPVFPGSIQVDKNGELIILGPDGGVTGGYPVLGVVPVSYISLISRLVVGETVRLRMTTPDKLRVNHTLGRI